MFADDEDEEEDMVAGGLSESEDDDEEVGVVAGQSRQLSASASARAGADEEGISTILKHRRRERYA